MSKACVGIQHVSGCWLNFGYFGSSWCPWGGSDGKEEETGSRSRALKPGCHGGWHGGWDWSQATLQVPLSTFVTPLEFPHDLTSPGIVAKRMRIAGLPLAKHPSDTHKNNSSFKFSIKEQNKITWEPVTCPPPVWFFVLFFFRLWASVIASMFTFLEVEKLEREGSELITSFSTQCWLLHFFVQYFARPLTFI